MRVKSSAADGELSNIERRATSAYFWNTVGGLLMAFQSVIMLMVLTRVCDVTLAGVFTLAYANANLFLNLGKYGERNFQVSDIGEKYLFSDYRNSRAITTIGMILAGSLWLIWSAVSVGYSIEKTLTVFMMLLFKAVDSIEDVYQGNYQQHGRLDIGAKCLTLRIASTIVIFAASVIALRSLFVPLTIATVYTVAVFIGETLWVRRKYKLPTNESKAKRGGGTWGLLLECFPVFLATFLLFYIGNAPKYAIDAVMDDAAQAYYGYIAMPVFVVGLLAGFIYNPIIGSLAEDWGRGDRHRFAKRLLVQCVLIVVITLICVVGAWLIGIPVLGFLYNANLSPYRMDLIILLVGGGFLALVSLFTTGITIIRWQRKLMLGYVIIAALAAIFSPIVVGYSGVDGASWIYCALMAVLSLWFGAILYVGIRKANIH